jgi:hypothetical protein
MLIYINSSQLHGKLTMVLGMSKERAVELLLQLPVSTKLFLGDDPSRIHIRRG